MDGCGRSLPVSPGVEAPSPKHTHASDSVRRQIEPNTPDDPKGSADFEAPGIRIDGFGGSAPEGGGGVLKCRLGSVGVRWGPLWRVVDGCGGLWAVSPGVEAPSPKHAHASDSVRRQ